MNPVNQQFLPSTHQEVVSQALHALPTSHLVDHTHTGMCWRSNLSVEVDTPPEAQFRRDGEALSSRKGISHPHNHSINIDNSGVCSFDGEEPGCDTGRPAVLCCKHASGGYVHPSPRGPRGFRSRPSVGWRLHYRNSLPSGVPACVVQSLQLIQNAAGLQPIQSFPTLHPSFTPLHLLPVAAELGFKSPVLAYLAANGSGPSYI